MRSFTKILQRKNIKYGPIKHKNACVPTLSFNNFLSFKGDTLSYGISSSRSTKKKGITMVPVFMVGLPLGGPLGTLRGPVREGILNGYYLNLCFGLNYSRHLHLFSGLRKFSSFNSDRQLYYYLAGLIEGDGCFYVPKTFKTEGGKTTTASIEVVFALKDAPSAEFLKDTIGGNVYKRKDKNCVR